MHTHAYILSHFLNIKPLPYFVGCRTSINSGDIIRFNSYESSLDEGQNSLVKAITLQAEQSGTIPKIGKDFYHCHCVQMALRPKQPPIQWVTGNLSPVDKAARCEKTTNFYLVLRLRMCKAILPLPRMSLWRGQKMTLYLLLFI